MQKSSKLLCVILCVNIIILSIFVPFAFAESSQGRITGDGVRMRDKPATDKSSNTITYLGIGSIVKINGEVTGNEAVTGGGTKWYNVTYGAYTGYVYGKYVEELPPSFDEDFEKNLLNFPESYRAALRSIHSTYPNWIFIADNVGITLDKAIDLEYSQKNMTSTKKWVELSYGVQWRDVRADVNNPSHIRESRWTFASRRAIAYFMDPRNALTVTTSKQSLPNIFTFMQQSYDAKTQTAEGLRTVVAGTFLANGYGDNADAYITDIMAAAEESKVSPYVIATTIITEQGINGGSSLISGTYKGYEGYYNFFNYGAYESGGKSIQENGLSYAKEKGWNSRAAAILGGAKLYEKGYLSVDQDTYYYMDFNVKYIDRINHQYASSLYDQSVKAAGMRSVCTVNKGAALTFKIPVYSGFPETVYAAPTIADWQKDKDALSGGTQQPEPEPEPEPEPQEPERKRGDISGDANVDGRDLAIMRAYLLKLRNLNSVELTAADISGDGTVDGRDLAIITAFLLGLRTL